jgi:hypothetical protein
VDDAISDLRIMEIIPQRIAFWADDIAHK